MHRKKDWPAQCIVITIGLSDWLDSPRITVAVEDYPNRWTHHALVPGKGQIDGELLGWLWEACEFVESKR